MQHVNDHGRVSGTDSHVLDRFHVIRWFSAGLTQVRRDVQRRPEGSKPAFEPEVFRARFLLLRRGDTLTDADRVGAQNVVVCADQARCVHPGNRRRMRHLVTHDTMSGTHRQARWWLRPSVEFSKDHSPTGQRCAVSGGSDFGPSHVMERFQRGAPRRRLGGWRIKILAVASRAIDMEEVVILEVSEGDYVV